MSWAYGWQWAQAATQEQQALAQALAQNEQLSRQHQARRLEVANQAAYALSELTAALVPSLDREVVRRAAELTGYTPLAQYDWSGATRAEERQLRAELAALEQDRRWQHREHLYDPRGGKLVLEIAELEEARRQLAPTLEGCNHPRMAHLLEVGYGTPSYAVPFWRLSYYSDWEAGDQILERFPGKTFAELRDEYLSARDAAGSLEARLSDLRNELETGRAIASRHEQLARGIATVDARWLQKAREGLARHLAESGAQTIGPRLEHAPDVDLLAKRYFGLAAKLGYLDGLGQAQLGRIDQELRARLEKVGREITKWSRPKNAHVSIPPEVYQRRFTPRQPWVKGWQRYQRASDTIYVFDRYDRGSWASEFLWWDLMTDGRIDGDFLPEVQWHHQRHPDYHYEREAWDDDPATAAATAGSMLGPADHDSGFLDPS